MMFKVVEFKLQQVAEVLSLPCPAAVEMYGQHAFSGKCWAILPPPLESSNMLSIGTEKTGDSEAKKVTPMCGPD